MIENKITQDMIRSRFLYVKEIGKLVWFIKFAGHDYRDRARR